MRLAPFTQSLTEPLLSPLVTAITGVLGGGFNPRNLFAANEPGYLYDLDDLSTVFLDSAGTTPATVNGLVGLQLDKSAGLVLGAETVVDGGFDTGTGWTAGTGWTISGGVASASGSTADGLRNSSAAYTTGKWYLVSFDKTGGATATVYVRGNSPAVTTSASGRISLYVLAGGSARGVEFYLNGAGTIDNVSVKELPGNHRYQTTTGSKPVLRGTPTGGNLVTNGGFDSDTAWNKNATAPATSTISGGKLTLVSPAGEACNATQNILTVGKTYLVTGSVTIRSGSLRIQMGTSATGVGQTSFSSSRDFAVYLTANGTDGILYLLRNAACDGDFDNITVYDVSADSVTAPYALQYDGVDDFLQTAAVDFTATDKMFVCAGVRKLSDTSIGILSELGTGAQNGSFLIGAPANAGTASFNVVSRGTANASAVATNSIYAAPVTTVLSALCDISADVSTLRLGGSQVATSASDQGTGNFGNYPLYFGRRNGTSLPYNGLMYSSVCIGRLLTAAELANVERWVARKTGVTL